MCTTATAQSQEVIVKSGDTLGEIFKTWHIPQADLSRLLATKTPQLTHLRVGERLSFTVDNQNRLVTIELPLKKGTLITFSKAMNGKSFNKKIITPPKTTIMTFKYGNIGALPRPLYKKLAYIFRNTVNLNRPFHTGDEAAIVYNEVYSQGQKIGLGDVLAAELTIQHRVYKAIRFESAEHTGYYTPDGESLDALFLKYPLKFKRISSGFNHNRLDPVLHSMHPHLGIDFAASRGTPIYSIGDGRITFIGTNHGYGNTIKIKYGAHYRALYGHMRNFAPHLKVGKWVHKGDIIGYVGSTGWATGSHLHFGFYINGVAVDWLKIDHPLTVSLPSSDERAFKRHVRTTFSALESHRPAKTRKEK